MSKGSGRRKENKSLIDKNWDNIRWGVKDELKGSGTTYEEATTVNDEMTVHHEKMAIPEMLKEQAG